MLDVLQFIFRSLWRFIGTVLLMYMLIEGCGKTIIYTAQALRKKP